MTGAAERYAAACRSVIDLVRPLDADDLDRPVPACPGWSVADVVAHLAGVATDNVREVSAGDDLDAWTAGHVAVRAGLDVDTVIAEWEQSATLLAPRLEREAMRLPAVVLDVVTHEHDIRGALGAPGHRDDSTIAMAAELLRRGWMVKIDTDGLAPLSFAADGGTPSGAPAFVASAFELFRGAFGRRSAAQLRRRFVGVADPEPYIGRLCIFGPSELDIDE